VKARLPVLAAAAAALSTLLAGQVSADPAGQARNPCQSPEARHLLCPNLRIGPASEMYVDGSGPGRVLLRATSDVRSRGRGPMELRGRRNGWRTMTTHQRIYRAGGGHIDVDSGATLRFTDVGDYWGGAYWKVHELAQFNLRRATPEGRLGAVVRTSPKLNYCLRDLERTRPGRRSPGSRHYPGCNQNPYRNRVTLGTSVGWSDVYPAPYHQQWIEVSGLRGCFAFEMTVDPENLLYESNEGDNSSRVLVRLPFGGRRGC
jgi:hypothetical protein